MKYYTIDDIDTCLSLFKISKIKKYSKKKKKYYNIPVTFDIETTNAYIDIETNEMYKAIDIVKLKEASTKFDKERYQKACFMYVWQMMLNDVFIMGRTWDEFKIIMKKIQEHFRLNENKYIIIYVRNLEFEFQFIKHYFNFTKVFATEPHKVVYAQTNDGFMFKCSYFLAGCSLETTGKNLTKYEAVKQVGKLDYNLIRNSKTPLKEDEIEYCLYDVIVDNYFIRESMEDEPKKSLLKIPLTKTGYVRRYVKKYVLNSKLHKVYRKKVHQFTMDEKKYNQLKRCFAGGFTHSNALNTGITFHDVHSQDFTSSYPACLLLEKYPMTKPRLYQVKDYKDFIKHIEIYSCIFDIEFINIKMRDDVYENIISDSKCFYISSDAIINNGRVVSASSIKTSITEIDYENICQFYTFEKIRVNNMWISRKDYLPKELLECVLYFYKNKTELKDVEDKEKEYLILKGMLNAIFGMMVTDPVKPIIEFDGKDFNINFSNIQECLDAYNTRYDKFLVYEWGIYCTAYARRNLFTGVKELKEDYIYADTDSLKYTNFNKHKKYFDTYNAIVLKKIEKVCKKYKFDINDFSPKDIYGVTHTIGLYDYDDHYETFKTLGAKRYMVEYAKDSKHYKDAKINYNLTVSGLNKKTAIPYLYDLSKKENKSIFELFNEDMFISGEYSGKLLHTYLDDKQEFDCIDYLGNKEHVISLSGVHLEPSSYSLSLADKYKNYLNHIQTKYKKGD